MKVNRTYSMDYDLVIQLAKKANQSQEVCKAVRKHLNGRDNFALRDVSFEELARAVMSRAQCPQHIREAILHFLEL